MAADLGATTYSAVTWTAGDVITEAKLDAMVGNDQAYDSHAAQGLLLNNNKALAAKDAAGVNHNIIKLNASDILEISGNDGWNKLPTENVPAYASASTISNPTGIDWTKYIRRGDKVKFDQTSTKYFSVVNVTATTLTLTAGSISTVANAAISNFFYSKSVSPQGFPDYFDYAPTYGGSGSMTYTSVTTIYARFKIIGDTCIVKVDALGTTGGTASTSVKISVPISPDNSGGSFTNLGIGGLYDAGSAFCVAYADNTYIYIDKLTSNWGLGANREAHVNIQYRY